MSILDLHDPGAALPRYIAPPKTRPEPKFSAWSMLSSVPRGVAGAVADVSATALEALEPFGATVGRMYGETPEPGFGRKMAEDVRVGWAENMAPDAQTSHAAEQVLYQFARGATKIMAGSALAGPAGVVAMGGEEAVTQTRELQRKGVDDATAWKAGGVQGAGLALAALPLLGKTMTQTAALYLAGGPGGFMAQQALTREILQAGGYDQIGAQYDPFDPVGLAVSSLIPAVFTAAGLRSQRKAAVQREVADAARVALQAEQRRMSNPAPEVPRSADLHEAALVKAEDAIARGEPVQVADMTGRPAFEPLESFLAREKVKPEALPPEVPGDFYAWLRSVGGIDIGQKLDISGDANNVRGNPAGIFRQGGNATDTLAEMAVQAGYLRPDATSGDLVALVQQALRGEPVRTFDQQMAAAARMDAEASMQSRLEAVEARLRLLGVDPTPAGGNVAALEAYAKAHEPAILRAALDEARAADESRPEFDELRTRAEQIARDIEDGGRTLEAYEREVTPLSPVMRRLVSEAMTAKPEPAAPAPDNARPDAAADAAPSAASRAAESPGVAAEQAAAPTRIDAIRAQFPDLMVQMDGMDKPMRLDDFIAAVKTEADEMAADAPLMQVAAECALLHAG